MKIEKIKQERISNIQIRYIIYVKYSGFEKFFGKRDGKIVIYRGLWNIFHYENDKMVANGSMLMREFFKFLRKNKLESHENTL